MKTRPGAVLAVTLVVCLILGCASAVKSVKQDSKEGTDAAATRGPEASEPGAQPPAPPAPPLEKPTYEPPSSPPKEPAIAQGEEEARGAAMLLIRNIPNLRGAKVCYSKSDGEWVLYVYKGKGPKITMQQYTLDPGTKEFVITGPQDEIPKDKMDFYLKTEVADQTCSILNTGTDGEKRDNEPGKIDLPHQPQKKRDLTRKKKTPPQR